ncbi:hypothetical protein BX666DRAFT_1621423 [Dichotomocladium elegans]|nr:hypothetical protein BX666DRAFT_1621423 [Dichotomocladium elegans]
MGSVNIEHLLFALEQDQSIRRHEEEKATEDAEVFEMGEQPEVAVAETKNGGRNTTDSFVIQACNTDIKIEKQEVCRSDAEVTRDSLEPTILMAAYEENTENDTTERFLEMTAVENSTSTLHTQIGYAQPMEDNGYEEPECVDHNETEAEKTTNTIFVLSPISKQSSRASSITSNDEGDAILGALESLDGTPSTATPTPASSLPSPTSPMHFLLPHCKDVVSMHPVKRHANPHYLLGIHTCTTHFLKPFLRTSLWSHRRCPSWSTVVMGIESVLLANRLALLEKQETQQCEEVDDHMISKEAVQKSERAGDEENCDLLTSDGIHARHWVRSASPQFAGRLSPASIPRASSGVGTSGCFLIQRLVRCARGLFKATVVHKSAAYCAMFYLLMSRQLSQLFRLLAGSRTHTQLYQ